MKSPFEIDIRDYDYLLPEERIARYPLANRDASKLLYYRKGEITERRFQEIAGFLPEKSLLVFNETKVIQARLVFHKETGARIEIFCLEPVKPVSEFQMAFGSRPPVIWKCLVGNAKRWRHGNLELKMDIEGETILLKAEMLEKIEGAFLVEFDWDPHDKTFSEILEHTGLTPLPPYLNREAEASDRDRYQTIYARSDGSVAAPTAGLHFTDPVFRQLAQHQIASTKVTLHVGAGTFKPVIASSIADHEMHAEKTVVSLETLKVLQKHYPDPVIPVGTTSMRTLESLYWLARRIVDKKQLKVMQWDPYEESSKIELTIPEALQVLIDYLEERKLEALKTETQLMIAPGYTFKICDGIITNFHQPKSTLLLLVSALIGSDWKKAYNFALEHDFRFLSYGDSCLFLP
jgi:S-adenosylmethionine:tRNA ribosyltransferase-isomerase